jgi:gluconolactonase
MSKQRDVTGGLRFPEGPVAMPDGSVILVEIAAARLTRVLPDGTKQLVAQMTGGPNGAALGPDGKMYVCNNGGFEWVEDPVHGLRPRYQSADYSGGRIERVDLKTGAIETLYTETPNGRLRGPNDIVFDGDGGFWFTDLGKSRPRERDQGGVYYARADGSFINGSRASDPDAERHRPVARRPDRLRRRDRGRAALGLRRDRPRRDQARRLAEPAWRPLRRRHASLPALRLAGGGGERQCLRRHARQSLHHGHRARRQVVEQVETDDLHTTNICFGGPDLKTAYITLSNSGRLVAMDWPRAGLPLHWLNKR